MTTERDQLMLMLKMPGGKSEDDKFEDAKRFLPILLIRFPDYSDFQLHDIITKLKEADLIDRKAVIDCQNQIIRLLSDNHFAETGTNNLQLKLTEKGRIEKQRINEYIEIEKRKREVSPEQYLFNDYMNATIEFMRNETNPQTWASIWFQLKGNYPHIPLHEVISELSRLNIIRTGFDSKGKETYLLLQPAKKQIENLPKEYIGNPYDFFLTEEERKQNESFEKHNLELQKLRDEVFDYREKWQREKKQYLIALITAIITTIGLILTLLLK